MWQGSKLKVVHPPFEIIAASKLAAGRERDFDDVKFLFQLEPDLANKIEQTKLLFNEDDQLEISDNLIIIGLMLNKPPKTYKMNSDQKIPEGLPARLTEKYLRINALYEHKKSPRDCYVNGIMQLSEFKKSRDHFF